MPGWWRTRGGLSARQGIGVDSYAFHGFACQAIWQCLLLAGSKTRARNRGFSCQAVVLELWVLCSLCFFIHLLIHRIRIEKGKENYHRRKRR